jgi:hypothetical protein
MLSLSLCKKQNNLSKNKRLLGLVLITSLGCVGAKKPLAPTHNYNIGILAYGSLINQPVNPSNNICLQINGSFDQADLTFPISLLRLSSKNKPEERATRVIDYLYGMPMKVYFARSKYGDVSSAMQNLSAREGALNNKNIFYIRKLLKHETLKPDEEEIIKQWVQRKDANLRRKVPKAQALKIIQWAKDNNLSAVIWASFMPNQSFDSLGKLFQAKPKTLENTKNYIKNLPSNMPLSLFEQEILKI